MAKTVILGAGIVGLCCAHMLRKRGAEVLLLDRTGPARACSAGNGGWVVPSFSAPLPTPGAIRAALGCMLRRDGPVHVELRELPGIFGWLRDFLRYCTPRHHRAGIAALVNLNRSTMDLYDMLERDGVEFEMHRSGLLFAFLSEKARDAALCDLEIMRQYGSTMPRSLSSADVTQHECALSPHVKAGFHVERDRDVRPESLCAGLARKLAESGIDIRHIDAQISPELHGRTVREIITSEGKLTADTIIIAAGVWSGSVAHSFGAHLPIIAGKGCSITVENPNINLRGPVYFGESKAGCTPFAGALRLAGTLDLSTVNDRILPQRLSALRQAPARYLRHEIRGSVENEWMGMRPLTPDGLPIIGRLPGFDNVYVATGHAMLGVTLAPATACAITDLICTGGTEFDLRPFHPGRFDNPNSLLTEPSALDVRLSTT